MKIVQIIPTFDYGGAEIMVENLLYGLKEKGHDVSVICISGKKTVISKRVEEKGIKNVTIKRKNIKNDDGISSNQSAISGRNLVLAPW